MSTAYIDTSCIVATAFGEANAGGVARRLRRFERVVSSPLLEAELFSTLIREGRELSNTWAAAIEFVIVNRALTPEITRVLSAGYVRGADCWHLATALYVAPDPSDMAFVTLDSVQANIARKLGFRV